MKITFNELEKLGHESVTDLCRALMTEGIDPETKIEVYRGDMLCLTVSSIEEGAKIDVLENKNTGPRFVKYKDTKMTEEAKARLHLKGSAGGVGAVTDAFK